MDINILLEKEKELEKAKASYNKEYAKWRAKAKEIANWLDDLLRNNNIENNLLRFNYKSCCNSLNFIINKDSVHISINNFENEFVGSISIPVDIFVSDDKWKNYLVDIVKSKIKTIKQNTVE